MVCIVSRTDFLVPEGGLSLKAEGGEEASVSLAVYPKPYSRDQAPESRNPEPHTLMERNDVF